MSESLDKTLQTEAVRLKQDEEIARVLRCSQWDYFSILEINPLLIDLDELKNIVKKAYRKKSLFIHPDKTSNRNSELAFDRLKKAEQVLSSQELKTNETSVIDENAKSLINEKKRLIDIYVHVGKLYPNITLDDNSDSYKKLLDEVEKILNEEMKHIQVDKDYQQRQEAIRLAEIKKQQNDRELKKQYENKWEDERDHRVNNWRNYTHKIEKSKTKSKKKSKKPKLLA